MGKADSQLACWEVSRGQGRTLQPSRPHLQPFLSPWHGQMPTAHQTSRQALSPTTWGSQSATTRGGGEAEVPDQVPSVSCPQSWGRSPAGSLEQSIRFLGGWGAGGWQGLEPALGRHLAPNSNPGQRQWSLIGGRVSGGRSAAGGLSVTGSLRQHCAAGLQRGLGGHPGPLGTPARPHIADPLLQHLFPCLLQPSAFPVHLGVSGCPENTPCCWASAALSSPSPQPMASPLPYSLGPFSRGR